MKITIPVFLTLTAYLLFTSCRDEGSTAKDRDKKINKKNLWLLGEWQNRNAEGGVYLESWKQLNDSVIAGDAYFIRNSDTLFSEKIIIVRTQDSIFYIPTVSDQHDGKPVRFYLNSISPGSVDFINPEHDFPQEIVYYYISPDSMVAIISGQNSNGKVRSETFPMKKKVESE